MSPGRQSGLGRGLSALIPAAAPGQSGLISVRLSQLLPNPRQPRTEFDDAALDELAASIRLMGLLQPIIVRPAAGAADDDDDGEQRYEIVAGERRFRAARMAGLDEIPAVVRRTEDGDLLAEALVENIHRSDLNPLEEAFAYRQLLEDFGITHETLASRLGKSRSAISNALRLLNLPASVHERIVKGTLSAGHARALLSLEGSDQQERAAQRIVADGLSVRATEDLVKRFPQERFNEHALGLPFVAKKRKNSPYLHVQRRLSDALGTNVEIKGTPRRGRVMIDYAGQDDLERLLEILSRGTGEDLLREEP